MPGRLTVSIIVIGDEILDGFVADTNSGWLAERLRRVGVPLERIVTVRDGLTEIAEALSQELTRDRPRLILTSGGIGSTPDDLTMAAVARCLDVGLVTHAEIDARISAMIHARLETVDGAQRRALGKMAEVPDGAYLLAGADGVAPGVAIDVNGGFSAPTGATVVVLPGIPAELRRIYDRGVEPLIADQGQPDHVAELSHPYPESTLTPLLEELTNAYPSVGIGSYPGRECVVRAKGNADEVEAVLARVRARLDELAGQPSAQQMATAWRNRWDNR